MRLYLVAGKVTDSVTRGFLPAAARLGLEVVVLTDRPSDHERAYGSGRAPEGAAGLGHVQVTGCAVTDFREIIEHARRPDAIFSNSDHLQAPTALAAAYFGLPAKDWQAATRTKNKALMRRHLADLGLDRVATGDPADAPLPPAVPFPAVLKPREGVASEDVFLVSDATELSGRVAEIRRHRADPLVLEEYLPGPLHTLETLGDGRGLAVLGSFRTALSPPPFFVEERLDWAPPPPETGQVLTQLAALGVGFGACHTEFVVHEGRARLIEVNYRIIGDHGDFLLADLLGVPVFEYVLRLHLGEPLDDLLRRAPAPGDGAPVTLPAGAAPRSPGRDTMIMAAGIPWRGSAGAARHAAVDNVLAERSGTLTAAPGPLDRETGGVRLTYRPLRAPGDRITLTRTNRDYLGIIQVIAPSPAAVETALRAFRAEHTWEIR
ncbi:siderophore biosynthesis protein [Actinomadura scrupuli]|uniref:siderophore biosynthesis protein n=1 Tax=Actinomadura scrupuli TaxID=559629 RepID=UPI003D9818FD